MVRNPDAASARTYPGVPSRPDFTLPPDYYPVTDIKKYPRTSVASVSPIDNEYNAWATKATVKTTDKEEAEHGLLAGKRVVLKVNRAKRLPVVLH